MYLQLPTTMDYMRDVCVQQVFRSFVCVALTLLVGLQVYAYVWGWGPQDVDKGFGDVKHAVMQLSRTIYEVNLKHVRLQNEMERISSVLPAVADAAGRAKDAIEPSLRQNNGAIDVRDYDRQIADYALETTGTKIVDTGDTIDHMFYETSLSWLFHVVSTFLCRECQGARAMIQPGTLPGECWAFKGSRGEATLRFAGTVRITGISMEHIPAHISPTREISSAPRLFHVEGLEFRWDPNPHDFGSFEYNKEGKPIQYFEVLHPSTKGYNFVRVRVLTNWGHLVYTCIYRVRVHGELETAQSLKKPTMEDELQIENEEVVLKTRLVRALMDQSQRTVRVSSTMHRTFGRAQWVQLRGILHAWRANVQQAHDAMQAVTTAQIEYTHTQQKA